MKKNRLLFTLTIAAALTVVYFLSKPELTINSPEGEQFVIQTASQTEETLTSVNTDSFISDDKTTETTFSTAVTTGMIATSANVINDDTSASTYIDSVISTEPAKTSAVTTLGTTPAVTTTVITSEEKFFSEETVEAIGNVKIVAEKGVSQKFYQELKDTYNSFPDRIKIAEKIIVTPENLATKFNFKIRTANGIIGGASSGKEIYISTMTNTLKCTLAHELGHCVDCELGWISKTDEVHNIYVKDYPALSKENINFYNEKEYFASSIAMFYISPDRLKAVAPDTYTFISETLAKKPA